MSMRFFPLCGSKGPWQRVPGSSVPGQAEEQLPGAAGWDVETPPRAPTEKRTRLYPWSNLSGLPPVSSRSAEGANKGSAVCQHIPFPWGSRSPGAPRGRPGLDLWSSSKGMCLGHCISRVFADAGEFLC